MAIAEKAEVILRFGFQPSIEDDIGVDTQELLFASQLQVMMKDHVHKANSRREAINAHPDYNDVGRLRRIKQAGEDELSRLVALRETPKWKHVVETQNRLMNSAMETSASQSEAKDGLELQREIELRTRILDDVRIGVLSPGQLGLEVLHAIESGKDAFLRAVLNAPEYFKLFTPEEAVDYRKQWLKARYPELARSVEQNEEALKILNANHDDARAAVREIAMLPEETPLIRIWDENGNYRDITQEEAAEMGGPME